KVRLSENTKKINDYFKHQGNSPHRHSGAKSPSPQAHLISHHNMALPQIIPSSSSTGNSDTQTLMLPPSCAPTPMVHKATQSDLSLRHVEELESRASTDMEAKNNRIDNLQCNNDELSRQLLNKKTLIEQMQLQFNKCIDVVKKLLIEKSNIEKKE
ncbi:UNVERIFIED_CONTAM: hypothetical protein GTU68_064853, partial [Idotea baltica]|nr:hypothetical protein [Idotea baltica]